MNMRLFLLFPIFLLNNLCQVQAQDIFPEKCIGKWEGTMYIFQKGKLRDSVGIKFSVAPKALNIWSWKTEYISDKYPLTKDYKLILEDSINGRYLVDEGNDVKLYDYLFGNKLYSVFETHNILLTSSYELTKSNELIFEVTSGKKLESKPNDEVHNYSVESLQRVVLHKIN